MHVDLPVTVGEALRGATVEVPTLSGNVRLRVPPGSQSGQTLRLRGKGIARRKQSGDLYVHLSVRVPEHVDAARLEGALAAIEAGYGGDVRAELKRGAAA